MGACVSIAFVAAGTLEAQLRAPPVARIGFEGGPSEHEEDTATIPGRLRLCGEPIEAIWRLYAREGFTEQVVDLAESDYDTLCERHGRVEVARALYQLAEGLMSVPELDPVVVGLEVEVEGPVGSAAVGPLVLQRTPPGPDVAAVAQRRPWGWAVRAADDPRG